MEGIIGAINAIDRCGRRYRTDAFAPLGLKGCHGRYLREICRNPGMVQEQLTESVLVNKSNVARQVAVLEESGFVIRKPSDEDKRVMQLYLTEKTEQMMPQIRQILMEWENILTESLTPEELESIAVILGKMKEKAAAWMEAH